MPSPLRILDGPFSLTSAALLPLCLTLSACGGGGGGGLTSIPPPPPPPPPSSDVASIEVQTSWLPSPATKAGSYDLLALISLTASGASSTRMANPGEFRLDVSKQNGGFQYVLDGPSSFLPQKLTNAVLPVPTDSWAFNPGGTNYRYDNPYEDYLQFFGQNLKEYEVHTDGSKVLREDYDYDRAVVKNAIVDLPSGQWISESLVFDAGLSYVAMGEWSWGAVTVNADGSATPTGETNTAYFVYGNRTPSSGIPASGTATYDAHTLGGISNSSIPFSLTADFGQRSISTEISQSSVFDVSGNAPFSNDGSFDIPLSGTAGSEAATGAMDGAFFGPHAEQVGGVFSVGTAGGGVVAQDAFVGQQPPH
jgi:hypothetical protein